MTPALRRIITQLTALRMANGWTQKQVAERANIHPDYVSDIERMRRWPSASNISSIADLYGLELTLDRQATVLLETTADMGAEIRRIRLSLGLTLQDITDATGIHASSLSAYEHDRRRPDPETLLRIVAALGCRLAIVGAR